MKFSDLPAFAAERGPVQAALLQRLIEDPRMAPVWLELRRRSRAGNQEPLYPRGAAVALVIAILEFRKARPSVFPRRYTEKARARHLEIAAALRHDAKYFAYLPSKVKCLAEAAQFYEEIADELTKSKMVVKRDTGDGEARAFAIALCDFFQEAFQKPAAYSTIATIATVVLHRDITLDAVREWCRIGG
jgi:hypothetical protein